MPASFANNVTGTWCEIVGNGARVGGHDIINIEGVEPRNSNKAITEDVDSSEGKSVLSEESYQTSIKENNGVRAIHSDVYNSGKLLEYLGSQEGLHH